MNLWWIFLLTGILIGTWLVRKNIRENLTWLWLGLIGVEVIVWAWFHIFARSHQGSEHYWWLFLLAGFAAGAFLFSWKIRRGVILLLLTGLKKVEEALLNKGDDDEPEIKNKGNRIG